MKAANQSRKLSIESLEKRVLMAGNVSVSVDPYYANLQIKGDSAANEVSVEQIRSETYRISGLNGTKINGVDSIIRGVPSRGELIVDLGSGNDKFFLNGGSFSAVHIGMGQGQDVLALNNLKTTSSAKMSTVVMGSDKQPERDIATFNNDQFFGSLYLQMGGGDDRASFKNTRVSGWLLAYGDRGYDELYWENSSYGRGGFISFEDR